MTEIIRHPGRRYHPALTALAETMHAGSHYESIAFDREKFAMMLQGLTIQPEHHFHYLSCAVRDGVVVGGMLGMVQGHVFANALLAVDMGLFVKPESRKNGAGLMLIHDFEQWAKEAGAVRIVLGNTAESDPAKRDKITGLYSALGYRTMGVMMDKHLVRTG